MGSSLCFRRNDSGEKVDLGRGDFSIDFKVVPKDAGEFLFYLYQNNDKGEWDGEKIKEIKLFQCGISLEGVGFLRGIESCYGKVQHIAISVRRNQFRIFVNGERVVSVPWKLEQGKSVTGFAFEHTERVDPYGYLVSDIRAAKYTEKEVKPSPEKLGIGVEQTSNGMKLTIPEKVLFDFNKFILKPEAKKALSVVADLIREQPVNRVIIIGYTDNVGSDKYNFRLSLQRAQSVADYLIYCEKIDSKKIEIVGRGKDNPVASNNTKEGRAKNRRVEIKIIEKKK